MTLTLSGGPLGGETVTGDFADGQHFVVAGLLYRAITADAMAVFCGPANELETETLSIPWPQ